jgi:hypothetical protein
MVADNIDRDVSNFKHEDRGRKYGWKNELVMGVGDMPAELRRHVARMERTPYCLIARLSRFSTLATLPDNRPFAALR